LTSVVISYVSRVVNDCVSYELGIAGIFKPTVNVNLHKTYNDNVVRIPNYDTPKHFVVNEVNVVSFEHP